MIGLKIFKNTSEQNNDLMSIDHSLWMKQALLQAEKAFAAEEVPVGAIVVHKGKVIGRGHNQKEQFNDPTAHAEMIAITAAANTLGDWRLNDCSIYITKEPCVMCYGAILNSRIKCLYYGFEDEENGFKTKINFHIDLSTKHLRKIEGNILGNDCNYLVSNFFQSKRKKNKKKAK